MSVAVPTIHPKIVGEKSPSAHGNSYGGKSPNADSFRNGNNQCRKKCRAKDGTETEKRE